MDKITALFEKLNPAKLVPQMDTLLETLQLVATFAVMAGPLVMLFLGLWYLLVPPKEANHSAGFRTWFGMGSVVAWRKTQKIAGFAWGICGLILSVVMWLISRGFGNMDALQMADMAFSCVLWQIGVALISYLGICVVVTALYDSKGRHRWKK